MNRPNNAGANRRSVSEILDVAGSFARARVALRGASLGARVRCYNRVLLSHRPGVAVGDRVVFLRGPIPTELQCEPGAELAVGSRTVVGHGVSITARRSVRVGARCTIASMVHIRDHDGRRTAPVIIGDDVWIHFGAVIEPGSVIGDGAVVSAMAVVSGTVPARAIAAGNPAQCVPLAPAPDSPPPPASDVLAVAPPARPRPAPTEVRAAIIEWLDDTRCFGDAERLVANDTPWLRSGLLDSLGLVELIVMLERRFGVFIDRERAASPEAQNMQSFVKLVTRPSEP